MSDDLRGKIVGALNIAGAFCDVCDLEPGDSLDCKVFELTLNRYADAVLAVIDLDKIRAEAQVQALEDLATAHYLDGPRSVYDTIMRRAKNIAREAGIETGENDG